MKTRQGFVSNSSSSSFVIPAGDTFPTVKDLALCMIKHRDWNNSGKEKAHLRALCKTHGDNIPVSFNTCNYDTYIVPVLVEGVLFFAVSTCNNHDWPSSFYDQEIPDNVPQSIYYSLGFPLDSSTKMGGDWYSEDYDNKDQLEYAISHAPSIEFFRLNTSKKAIKGHKPLKFLRSFCPQKGHYSVWVNAQEQPICADCGSTVPKKVC